jgi:hypothetical protein
MDHRRLYVRVVPVTTLTVCFLLASAPCRRCSTAGTHLGPGTRRWH